VHADSSRRQNKRVGNYDVIYAKENQLGSGEGALPRPQKMFSILSLKMATLVHSGRLPTWRGGMTHHAPLDPPVYVPLSPSSITWYRPGGGDALWLGR